MYINILGRSADDLSGYVANVSERRALSIFRAEVNSLHFITSVLKMETARFSETLASATQYVRRRNPKDHHKNRHPSENLISHVVGDVVICT
jgi:hypothetical protein